MTIQGVIEKKEIQEGMGVKGPWRRWCFTIAGKKYSTFDNLIGENFFQGDNVVIEGKIDGKFFNMQTMVKAGTTAGATTTNAQQQTTNKGGDTQDKIVRMACLKASVDFLKAGAEVGSEMILICAEQFVKWVNQDGN